MLPLPFKTLSSLALVLGLCCANAQAADVFQVTGQISASCVLLVPGSIEFGVYDSLGTHITSDLNSSTTISVKCTSGTTSAIVYIDKGLSQNYKQCSAPQREMYVNGDINYKWGGVVYDPDYFLYQNSDMTLVWGCQTGTGNNAGVSIPSFQSSTTAVNLTVYGKIQKGKVAMPVGTYSDTVSVFVAF